MTHTKVHACVGMALVAMMVCTPLRGADDQVRVVPESQIKDWWLPPPEHPNAPSPYPVAALKSGIEGCMAVAFEIRSDGSVSSERLWQDKTPRFGGTKAWERATLLAVHQWRFVPAPANAARAPVYTYAVLAFTLSNTERQTEQEQKRQAQFQAECEMPDFPQQVQSMIQSQPKPSSARP